MKKKYFSPAINVYNIVEAETILVDSCPKNQFVTDVEKSTILPDEELDGETFTPSGGSTSVAP